MAKTVLIRRLRIYIKLETTCLLCEVTLSDDDNDCNSICQRISSSLY